MAGVSAGTVDRILHNRGNVSQESREAVDKVLSEVGYKYNIHTSAISLKRVFKIVICTPHAQEGDYWGAVQDGFERAFEEFSDIAIHRIYNHYNPFDIHSYHAAFEKTCCEQPDAVIISPSFIQEATDLCRQLDKSFIPYVFIDSKIDETYPVASFSTDQYSHFQTAQFCESTQTSDTAVSGIRLLIEKITSAKIRFHSSIDIVVTSAVTVFVYAHT